MSSPKLRWVQHLHPGRKISSSRQKGQLWFVSLADFSKLISVCKIPKQSCKNAILLLFRLLKELYLFQSCCIPYCCTLYPTVSSLSLHCSYRSTVPHHFIFPKLLSVKRPPLINLCISVWFCPILSTNLLWWTVSRQNINANLWCNIVQDNTAAKELLANLCRCNIVQAFQPPVSL